MPEPFHIPADPLKLYFAAMSTAISEPLREALMKLGLPVTDEFTGVWRVVCREADLVALVRGLSERLPKNVWDSVRYLTMSAQDVVTEQRLMQSAPLSELLVQAEGAWVGELLDRQAITTYFQPIVVNADPARVFAYECLMRAMDLDGSLIHPGRLIGAARVSGQMSRLDHVARSAAIETAARLQLDACVFVNFSPNCCDPPYDWESTIRKAVETGMEPSRIVFEVVESDEVQDLPRLMGILDTCREVGCRVALDDIGSGYNSLQMMARLRPDFIKLDMELIRNIDQDSYKSCVAGKLLELAGELDVFTVVEGVETVAEWQWSVEHGADYAQGYLFARPAAVPPIPVLSKEMQDRKGLTNVCEPAWQNK